MFVLEPIFHKEIWGGKRLMDIYGEQADGLAHLYSLKCKDKNSNIILNGKSKGRFLFDVIGAFPLQIAIVDAALDLSIQVHPDDPDANLVKYESYYFIEAPESGYIYSGIKKLSADVILSAVETGIILQHIGKSPVKSGDYVFIEPRTVHALTAGSFVYEIEQGVDNTYRLFDYNRYCADGNKRLLQIDKAIDVLDPSRKAVVRVYQSNEIIAEQTYETQLLTNINEIENSGNTYECLTLLSGDTIIDGAGFKKGMTVIIEPGEKLELFEVEKCVLARSLV